MSETSYNPSLLIAQEMGLPPDQIQRVVRLFEEENTVPFIARYRKEATGGMDEVQIRAVERQLLSFRQLESRRKTILTSISKLGRLDQQLHDQIQACTTRAALEDLYHPFKRRRKSRADQARERGLEPLANRILEQPLETTPEEVAAPFVSPESGVENPETAIQGAMDIIAEQIAQNPAFRKLVRNAMWKYGRLRSRVVRTKAKKRTKFEDYYDYEENVTTIAPHRFLAIRRGEREGILKFRIEIDPTKTVSRILGHFDLKVTSPFAPRIKETVSDAYQRLLGPSIENDVRVELKARADREAVRVFAENLEALLLAPPLGDKPVLGIDPGLRTGCKCAAVDATGTFLDSVTIYTTKNNEALLAACQQFLALIATYQPEVVAIGNGKGGRKIQTLVRQWLSDIEGPSPTVVMVSEAGASIYSASDIAREEFPDLDVTIRGAISIARRLQDPLAELVKIEPRSIGVGQYQHDVFEPLLVARLTEVVESCVNSIGVDLNTASSSLLGYVAGIGPKLARTLIAYRQEIGSFQNRQQLLDVSGLGPKTFQQAAGFLRIRSGSHLLDASAVHPEHYDKVNQIAQDTGVPMDRLVGHPEIISKIDFKKYVCEEIGEWTLKDIAEELARPGRDPRSRFDPPNFRHDVLSIEDLKPEMALSGVVTNVTAFGAFVDIGVHQDGLVHISQLADQYVASPSDVVRVGQTINVRVLQVDPEQKRISLSARSSSTPERRRPPRSRGEEGQSRSGSNSSTKRSGRTGRKDRAEKRHGKGRKERKDRNGGSKSHLEGPLRNNPFADLLAKRDDNPQSPS
ncbi:MAG: Tex family protein [Planctomycetota bacterium]|nr:Tex family protein [Planctomycetota bacterium]